MNVGVYMFYFGMNIYIYIYISIYTHFYIFKSDSSIILSNMIEFNKKIMVIIKSII